jgi:Na+/melibiose symporter-like transporter
MSQTVQIVASSDGLSSASLGQLQPLGSGKYAWIIAFFSFAKIMAIGTFITLIGHYVTNWGFSLQYLTVVGLITGIVGLFASLYIGYFGDTFVSKYGRRKPVVFIGFLVSFLSMFFLYIPPSTTNQKTMFSWMLLWQVLQTISSTFANQSLSSWFIESTVNNADYERLNNFVAPVSSLIGA